MSEPRHASQGNAGKLLSTKLMPPRLPAAVIQRADLLARLDEGLTKKLTVLTAPTGFGKTTLAGMWIASRNFPSAWVTLDENDNDPARFWNYVITGIRSFDPSLGKAQLSALMTSQPPSFESLLTPLINDLTSITGPCVLVLEDYQVINSDEIQQGVTFLIQHLPEALHLVLITRTSPNLPLAILRVRDEMIEINADGLRFNRMEAEAFLYQAFQTDLPTGAMDKLLEQTEGWVAGLRLVSLSLQNKGGAANLEKSIQSFSGSDRYVADYLIKEVFESQPEPIQMFLMKTCFLRRLTGSLCEAVLETPDGSSMLERLHRDNLFIVQLEDGRNRVWYRYSPLFAESIQYLAKQRLSETSIRDLFEKASAWYEIHGVDDEAIETALAAKSFDRAMRLIEKYIGIHELSEIHTLGRWLEHIPTQEIFLHPAICFIYSQIILYSSPDRFAPALAVQLEPFLGAAETAWRTAGDHQRLGELLSLRGIVTWWQGDIAKAIEYAYRSLDELPENDVLWRGNSLLIVCQEALNAGQILKVQDIILEVRARMGAAQNIHGVLAAIQLSSEISFWQGELDQAVELNQQILDEAIGGEEMLDDKGIASLGLAQVAYEKNDLEGAAQFTAQALSLAEQRSNEKLLVDATIRLAFIHAAKAEFSQADVLLKSLTTRIKNSLLLRSIQETQARFSILRNDTAALTGWLTLVTNDMENILSLQKEREVFTLARLWIAEGKADEALGDLRGWAEEAAAQGRIRSQVEALCLEALASHANADMGHAIDLLTEALSISRAKGFHRLVLDEGPRMAALLQAVVNLLPDRTIGLYARSLLHSFNPELLAQQAGTTPVEPLSQQEVRVLRLLVAGMSNPDIARELTVSTNTVKTHVKSIYRKLSINSREEARQMGRELNLL